MRGIPTYRALKSKIVTGLGVLCNLNGWNGTETRRATSSRTRAQFIPPPFNFDILLRYRKRGTLTCSHGIKYVSAKPKHISPAPPRGHARV